MANAGQPTKCIRHIEMKHFAIQDWVEKDLMILKWVSSQNNCSDSLTKALACTLQYKHMDYIMGHVSPLYNISCDKHNII